MRSHVLLLLAISPVLGAEPQKQDAVTQEQKRLQGTWLLVGREFDGEKATKDTIADLGGKWVVFEGKVSVAYKKDLDSRGWTFKLDPAAKPKAVDLTAADGNDKGQVFLGVYELKGDKLRVCYGSPKGKRPTGFDTKKDDGHVCLEFERAKE